jgi:hypothetical protein
MVAKPFVCVIAAPSGLLMPDRHSIFYRSETRTNMTPVLNAFAEDQLKSASGFLDMNLGPIR